ncbi:CECR6/TMEM121 family protein [Theileria parva strain Muguga]|uniref:CECR6/TMEM121 family protein n=1 Tax=Theileria parva strain Muguga TaxID=333668 RepID=UPI001C61982E|nr:CECR6/TMEM121 family protein [Theileria parva strain Muguga]EAN31316.2 CECR6/TMEM121 family protein [Theileria parva strain Muguga]
MVGKRFSEKCEIITWLSLSYILNLILLNLQSIGLMYYMYICQPKFIYMLIVDAFCLFKWTISMLPKLVGHKGSNCWVLYSRIFTIKAFIIFFWVLPVKPHSKGVLLKSQGGRSLEIMLLLFITPTVYTILAFSTGIHLYGGVNMVSSERLIHSDLILHVIFDYLDIIDIFHKFSIDYNSLINTFNFYKIFCSVFLVTPIFLHSYTFPHFSTPNTVNTDNALDINVGNANNSGRLMKRDEVYFCRKFAGIVGIFFVDLPFLFIRIYTWQSTVHYSAFAPFMLKNLCFILLQISRIRHTSSKVDLFQTSNKHKITPHIDSTNTSRKINEIKLLKMNEILLKILLMINVDLKCELAHYLDSTLNLSNWINILLSLPHFIFSLSKFILIIILLKMLQKEYLIHGMELLDYTNLDRIFILADYRIFLFCFHLTILVSLLILFIWSVLGQFVDALFVSILTFTKLTAFVFSLIVMCNYVDSFSSLEFISSKWPGKSIHYIFIFFSFKPFMNLLINLYPFLCVFLGKRKVYYTNPSTFKHKKSKLHQNLLFKNLQNVNKDLMSSDEICDVNLTSFVLLTNSKEMCCTCSSYTMMIGPNLIKSYRLHNSLFHIHKNKLINTLILRLFCLVLTIMRGGHFGLLLTIFSIEAVLSLVYWIYSCLIRNLSLESLEVQMLASNIFKQRSLNEFGNSITEVNKKVYKKYKKHQTMFKHTFYSFL